MDEEAGKQWIKVIKGNKIRNKISPYYMELSNQYSQLAEFAANPDPPTHKLQTKTGPAAAVASTGSTFKVKTARRRQNN